MIGEIHFLPGNFALPLLSLPVSLVFTTGIVSCKCKLMPDTEGSSRFRIPSEAKGKITRGRGLTGLDQHKMSANPD